MNRWRAGEELEIVTRKMGSPGTCHLVYLICRVQELRERFETRGLIVRDLRHRDDQLAICLLNNPVAIHAEQHEFANRYPPLAIVVLVENRTARDGRGLEP